MTENKKIGYGNRTNKISGFRRFTDRILFYYFIYAVANFAAFLSLVVGGFMEHDASKITAGGIIVLLFLTVTIGGLRYLYLRFEKDSAAFS